MNKIGNEKPQDFVQTVERVNKAQKKITRNILNNVGTIVGLFIIFVVIVVFTTDIKLTGAMKWAELSLVFFILLFCSYSMYVNYANSGTRAGKNTQLYIDTCDIYSNTKKDIIDKKYQSRAPEFCRFYRKEELKNTRIAILSEVGIDYTTYSTKYIGKDKSYLENLEDMSKAQLEAILRANAIKPINLTPEMIMKRGRGNNNRSPLGIKPETKKRIHFGTKFTTTAITSFVTGIIVLDVIINPTWATFAACCLKVLLVVLNGFMGYKMGYENIVIDTVEYMNDQVDLMNQLIQYVEANPEPRDVMVEEKIDEEPVEAVKEEVVEELKADKTSEAAEEEQPQEKPKEESNPLSEPINKPPKESKKKKIEIKQVINDIK